MEVFICNANTFTYQRTGLSMYAGQPFKFLVVATNQVGDSTPSGSIRILVAEVPGAPAAPTLVFQSKTQITIRWIAPTYTGGVPIESYRVYAKIEGTSYLLVHSHTDLTNLVFTNPVLVQDIGKTFYFQVSALNEVGEGLRSTATPIIAGTLPNAP